MGRVKGVLTSPVHHVLCAGTPNECALHIRTFVISEVSHMYDLLIGTPLINAWTLTVDPLTSTGRFRPFWLNKKDLHTFAYVPVQTSKPAHHSAKATGQHSLCAEYTFPTGFPIIPSVVS
jgi:hypothetical protein